MSTSTQHQVFTAAGASAPSAVLEEIDELAECDEIATVPIPSFAMRSDAFSVAPAEAQLPDSDPARVLEILLRSRHPLISCATVEERRFESLVRSVAADLQLPVVTWSATQGLSAGTLPGVDSTDLAFALEQIASAPGKGVWLFRDPQADLESSANVRALRETAFRWAGSGRTILLVGPVLPVRIELHDVEVRFDFAPPGRAELENLITVAAMRMFHDAPGMNVSLSPDELAALATELEGFTSFQAERALTQAIVEEGALTPACRGHIRAAKRHVLEEGGLLRFLPATSGFSRVGGLRRLKQWVMTRLHGLPARLSDSPSDSPRGILLLGVQGCGKSLAAKAIASAWSLPLVTLDMGQCFGPAAVESGRIEEALRRVDQASPCVLWIDEAEKVLAPASTERADSGASRRALGVLSTWMQERTSRVFLVMTVSSIEELPSELIRKGRLDGMFFVDLPGLRARSEILRVHIGRRGGSPDLFDLPALSEATKGFSGAEIEQAIVTARYESRAAGLPLDTDALLVAIRDTRPLSAVRPAQVSRLRTWAARNCMPADDESRGAR